jgi:Flp pilus assembly pilin Flp
LVVALIALGATAAMGSVGSDISGIFTTIGSQLTAA